MKRCLRSRTGSPRPSSTMPVHDFGMPMGPIELADVVGLDVALHVGRVLAEAFGRPVPEMLVKLVDQKKFGRKSGEGFYVWRDGKPVRTPAQNAEIPAGSRGPIDLADAERSRGRSPGGCHRRRRFAGCGRDFCDGLRAFSRRPPAVRKGSRGRIRSRRASRNSSSAMASAFGRMPDGAAKLLDAAVDVTQYVVGQGSTCDSIRSQNHRVVTVGAGTFLDGLNDRSISRS